MSTDTYTVDLDNRIAAMAAAQGFTAAAKLKKIAGVGAHARVCVHPGLANDRKPFVRTILGLKAKTLGTSPATCPLTTEQIVEKCQLFY